ncbi:hypothetical protein GQ53DRAFT_886778 [Thozetella sp. PMI_491]|nr:hypothetical protein GQ53DRAFT_886778 [Thozetella sp. PMI_491]
MFAAKLLPMVAFAISAVAISVPAGKAEGLYRVFRDSAGVEFHEYLGLNTTVDPQAGPYIQERQENTPFGVGVITTSCGCGYNLVHGDCDAAVQDLKNQVGGGTVIGWTAAYYSIRGAVVAFACNDDSYEADTDPNDSDSGLASADQLTAAYSYITGQCGWYVAGSLVYYDLFPTNYLFPQLGYMQYYDGVDFCGDAFNDPLTHC